MNSVEARTGRTRLADPAANQRDDPATDQMPGNAEAGRSRAAVRQIASGVAVLAVDTGRAMHGVTVSSLTAVSRDPLLVGLCLHRGSQFLSLLQAHRSFAVSVLDATQAEPAKWFSDPRRPHGRAQFEHVPWQPDRISGAPFIVGALAWLSARLVRIVDAGDHELLLAEVTGGSVGRGRPLLNHAGRLHEVTTMTLVSPASASRSDDTDSQAAGQHSGRSQQP
ncbi:flavin reductase family protein [Solwaraspora sp. WMMA2080]|uniref:flavin reductase family protein n=1 Tax=unclassified Solwaraspora TaxID=2627926 RepID=UPI00248C2E09|nr:MULTISPECIES: flavin reductase family protein [unclassified Solwaraspora]WBB95646.1 flavin reductase family protein [Solwaraspora sp. WMMA2059]WBC20450.1 flavin reductase family protein [Solwaraspora sp. WMMA2080]